MEKTFLTIHNLPCAVCGEPVCAEDAQPDTGKAGPHHRICHGIVAAALAADLGVACREAGYTMRVDEHGKELWSAPQEGDEKHG